MNGNEFIKLLGLTSDDEKIRKFLSDFGITQKPKLKKGDFDAIVMNEKLGIEITFTDERYLDVKSNDYEEGALVLSNVRMYGDGNDTFKLFSPELPLGLRFDLNRKEAFEKIGQKPARDNKETAKARWDFKNYCLFLTFDKKYSKIRIVAVQLPLE